MVTVTADGHKMHNPARVIILTSFFPHHSDSEAQLQKDRDEIESMSKK